VDEKRIDCDDAIYEVEPKEFKCESLEITPKVELSTN
jgi:hypothetical protein